jgi:hypothetical protein
MPVDPQGPGEHLQGESTGGSERYDVIVDL